VRASGNAVVDVLKRLVGTAVNDPGAPPDSIVIGLIGRGIRASRSPIMHEREGARLGMRYAYLLIDFDTLAFADAALGETVETLERLGFAGFNVTHPFKQTVIPHLTRLSTEASAIGAVNTVVLKDGSRIGYNTDCWGFATSFAEGMAGCSLERIIQFGAGGAGVAVAYALLELGAQQLAVLDSDGARATRLVDRLAKRFGPRIGIAPSMAESLRAASGIVNTTPVGMAKYPGTPFPTDLLRPAHWVAEIIYFPRETELLGRARALGCRTLAGSGMAIHQAVRAFELFTGVAPDRAAMTSHFEAAA
jgi:shikimate dehydrogenase